ncbi:MAG: ornithine carbamoyltransferase [Thermoplasmatales archaeon]|nr:ornithine carbamoyltransferase [Thermoplasmatales archaeon]
MKHLISILDVKDEIYEILDLASELKDKQKKGIAHELLRNKSLGMIFEKSSTRTRVSFEVGMTHLGGHALYLSPKDLQMGRGETVPDTAKVLSRFVDGIMYRAFDHRMMLELAKNSTVPVINGLDDLEHPCQIIADLLTIKEKKKDFNKLKLAYVGDGNNVCNSLLLGAAIVGMDISVGCPNGYEPNKEILEKAKNITKSEIKIFENPFDAVKNADIIYTDVWISMGDESEKEKREKTFLPYQVNKKLIENAKKDCIVMHCLPAHRGMEITDEVVDGEHSIVFDQAENRLHAQKAVMVKLMKNV